MVSIILPAYNAAGFLTDAVESVISQSCKDWELIIIDDGSTDRTPAIADTFASRDPRIRVVHTPNQRQSRARNEGLSLARGEFISFLDADDILSPGFLETTLTVARDSGAPIVATHFLSFSGNVPDFPPPASDASWHLYDSEDAIEHALYQTPLPCQHSVLDHSPWAKLYDARLWKSIRFPAGVEYEDLDIFYKVWADARKIAYIPTHLYAYRRHPGSYIHTFTAKRADVLDVTDSLLLHYSDDSRMAPAARTRRFAAHFNIFNLINANRANAPQIEQRCLNVIRSDRRSIIFNPKARLRDRLGALFAYFPAPLIRFVADLC